MLRKGSEEGEKPDEACRTLPEVDGDVVAEVFDADLQIWLFDGVGGGSLGKAEVDVEQNP